MQKWRQINKSRLEIFTDALIAIIMTVLVLDLKVPAMDCDSKELSKHLLSELPHFLGFVISFAVILVLWISHHDLFESLREVTRTFALINFLFVGAVAVIPFSTALAADYPSTPLAVAVLAANMLMMNLFLAFLHIYADVNGYRTAGHFPKRFSKIKRIMGISGVFVFLAAIFLAFLSTTLALILIAIVPLMHCIPIKEKWINAKG